MEDSLIHFVEGMLLLEIPKYGDWSIDVQFLLFVVFGAGVEIIQSMGVFVPGRNVHQDTKLNPASTVTFSALLRSVVVSFSKNYINKILLTQIAMLATRPLQHIHLDSPTNSFIRLHRPIINFSCPFGNFEFNFNKHLNFVFDLVIHHTYYICLFECKKRFKISIF